MRREFVPVNLPMDEKWTVAQTVEDVERLCPWASEIIEVEGGWQAFEDVRDAEMWRKQR